MRKKAESMPFKRLSHRGLARALAALSVPASCLVFWAAPAFAAAPETPETKEATPITGTTATLHGVLNPTKAGELGEYDFTYKQSATECAPEGTLAPEAPGTALGAEKEAVSVELTGLQPSKQYTFCVVATHTGESSTGAPKTFTTLAVKPAFESESGFSFRQTEATLEANINPNNQITTCRFEYGTSATLSGAASVPCEPATLEGFPAQHASANLAGLSPDTVYYYRVVAENGTGAAEGVPIQELRTPPPPPTVAAGVSNITDSSATLTGTVNPGSEGPESEAKYFFEYSTEETPPARTGRCQTCVAIPVSPQRVGGPEGGMSSEVVTVQLEHLLPLATYNPQADKYEYTTYHWRLVAFNGSGFFLHYGETADATFQTLPEPPSVSTDPPTVVGASTATLVGEVAPAGAPTTYRFEYGTSFAYGLVTPGAEVPAEAAGGGQLVTAALSNLSPDTVYHVRLAAKNSGGETQGEDRTFATNAAGEPSAIIAPGFSLTGTAPAGPTAFVYPNLAGFAPLPPPPVKPTTAAKPLTTAQKLAKALKACKKDKSKSKRTACEKQARKKYGQVKKKK